ncbi:MAG: hypothetical protein IJH39_11055 [Clostridia bacterium]|nr:hypothetical protein [Clostridia bacterium]
MVRNEFFNWLKEHNNKCSIKQLKELGLILKEDKNGLKQWIDSDGNICLIGYIETDNEDTIFTAKEYFVVDPYIPNTEKVVKDMQKWLDSQHYETPISIHDLNKKFYDKFYERKGRKYSHNR